MLGVPTVSQGPISEIYLYSSDIDSCSQTVKDRAGSHNTLCDLLTGPTICGLILNKSTELLSLKKSIWFVGQLTCGLSGLNAGSIASNI